jgi:aryl-alcohol dehydrogenase-like predicted oxidoreductase
MQTRKLGCADLELTTVGLGTWAMGGPWEYGWGPQDDNEAVAAVLAALETGINWIDTAPAYGLGHSEELIREALKQKSEKPIIATKCGILWNEKKEKVTCLKRESVREECHASLKRLGVEVIDLYQMHWPDPDQDVEQAWEEMAKLCREGKVRYLGVSNFNIEQIKRVQKIHPVASLQPPYSMLRREAEGELLDYCARNDIGVVAYSPMQRGLLTGKFDAKRLANLPLDDHRRRSSDFQEPQFSATLELVEGLKKIAKRNGRTCAQLAISWVLRRPEVTAAIVGARRPAQILETAPAAEWNLSKKDIKEIERLLVERDAKLNTKIK